MAKVTHTVQWPDGAYNSSKDDLSEPMRGLLQDLNLLEDESDLQEPPARSFGWRNATPPSLQVLTAGATSLSKATASFVAGVGGLSAILATVVGFATDPANDSTLMLVLVGSTALVLSAVTIAVAVIVWADVTARATATSAEYRARAQTAAALLDGIGRSRPAPRYWLRDKNNGVYTVRGIVRDGDAIKVQIDGGTLLDGAQIECLMPFADTKGQGPVNLRAVP